MTTQLKERILKWRDKTNQLIMQLLKGNHNHFLFFLPSRKGVIHWLLDRFFNGITIHQQHLDFLKQLPKDGIFIYTIKYKSLFEYLFYHNRYCKEKLPIPELGFGYRFLWLQPLSRLWRSFIAHIHWLVSQWQILNPYTNGYWQQELLNGRTALLPLVEKHGFYRRFVKAQVDPLRFLIELQQSEERPVILIPHLMFFSKSPPPNELRLRDLFLGSKQRPSLMRRVLILMRQPRKVFVEISAPLDLRKFMTDPEIQERTLEYQALLLRRRLLVQHNRHRQSITGPVIKSHEELKESILTNDRLSQFMTQHAESRKEPLYSIRKKADSFLDEIAAKYNFFVLSYLATPVKWLLNTMFDGTVVDEKGLQRMKSMSQKGPLILVPCHKSHIDYLILSFVLFHHNMPCPHIVAGKNLSFWPIGPLARAAGAFFIRRTFAGAVLYARVFSEYIHKLLEEGFNIELFIEGGRSRTGKLLMPKLGFLSMLLNAYKNGACKDMIFVPVYIGYDQVLEEKSYLHEIEGGKKKPENLSQVLRARHFLNSRYGKIYINFDEPLSLKELLQDYGGTLTDLSQKQQNILCRDLGWRIINAIDRVTVVTPHAVVAAAVLNCPDKRFMAEDIFQIFETYMAWLFLQKAKLTDTLRSDHLRACEQALENYAQRRVIERLVKDKEAIDKKTQFILPATKRQNLEYYKNNCIAYFVPAALTALAILEKDTFQFSSTDLHDRYLFLQDFFKYEFAFNTEQTSDYLIRKSIKSFIDDTILIPHRTFPDTYQITSAGLRKLKLFASFLKTYFESYTIVLQFYKQTSRDEVKKRDRIKKIQALGKTLHKRLEVELSESLSKINYINAISFFSFHRIKGSEDSERIKFYQETIQKFLKLL